jgi:hypothetical protein
MSIFAFIKGALGELQAVLPAGSLLDEKVYRSLHNVTIPTTGGTTQIVLVARRFRNAGARARPGSE